MHRARHTGAVSSALRHPRVLILLVVAGVGLATALWLPMRHDSASAMENGHDRRPAQGQHRDGWRDRDHDQDGRRSRHRERDRDSGRGNDRSASVSASSSKQPPPSRETPAATKWKPFSILTAGQLVSYGKVVYRVRETHTSLPGWEPPKLPELFKVF